MRGKILLVDDEASVRFGIHDFLAAHGFEVIEAESCHVGRERFLKERPDLALLDYKLRDGTALELLPQLRALDPNIPLVVLTGHASIDLAVQAIKLGAEQFFTKPVELPALLVLIERLIETQRARRGQLADKLQSHRAEPDPFLGGSTLIQELKQTVHKLLESDSPVLIEGETGTGKGVLAQWLHRHGPRGDEPFIQLNCAGLSPQFLETELFGHERGAFTGAVQRKQGLLEVAHHGTVFLDEIGEVDAQVQPKLLKVLEEQCFRRLGDVEDRKVDVRLIAATHQQMAERVRTRQFRVDLYYRISALPLRIPALRERKQDIPHIAESLLRRLAQDRGRSGLALTPGALAALQDYAWPGNIRELRNVLERAVLLTSHSCLEAAHLHFTPGMSPVQALSEDELSLTLREVERRHIERVLAAEGGHVERAAQRLGIPRSSLYEKLKRFGLVSKP